MEKPQLFFKAEANQQIGGGHLHRCITLANECTILGAKVSFVFGNSSEQSIDKIRKIGYEIHVIEKQKEFEIQTYLKFVPKNALILFDTDDYRFYSGKLIDNLRNCNIKTACFTISEANKISTDLLINTNIISQTHTYNTHEKTEKLLGPQYLIFNSEFWNIKTKTRLIRKQKNLLLFFGNADSKHLTKCFVDNLQRLIPLFNKIRVIVGSLNSDVEEIVAGFEKYKSNNISLHINIDNIIDYYKDSDIAITSAGMAMWEMALFHVSQIVIPTSVREMKYTDYISDLGYIYKLTDYSELLNCKEIMQNIEPVFSDERLNKLKIREFCSIINPKGIKELSLKFLEILK